MNDLNTPPPSGGGYDGRPPREALIDPAIDELDRDQVRRWAEVIANGDTSSINHFTPGNRDRIEAEARRVLRSRLMRLIARTIAQDIVRGNSSTGT